VEGDMDIAIRIFFVKQCFSSWN